MWYMRSEPTIEWNAAYYLRYTTLASNWLMYALALRYRLIVCFKCKLKSINSYCIGHAITNINYMYLLPTILSEIDDLTSKEIYVFLLCVISNFSSSMKKKNILRQLLCHPIILMSVVCTQFYRFLTVQKIERIIGG